MTTQKIEHPFGFVNEPMLDWSLYETRQKLKSALLEARGTVYKAHYPLLIGDERWHTNKIVWRRNPANTSELLGSFFLADIDCAERAIASAHIGKRAWAEKTTLERASILLRAAELMREKRYFFIALMMLEVGKGRGEADGEVAEAIEFLDYYARCAPWLEDLAQSTMVQRLGEENTWQYVPLGVGVSIQPWNFPLSLSVGATAAALVMGNAVIYKPATQSAITGYYMVQLLREAGVPANVLHCLPAPGGEVGKFLIEHPGINFVAFTGSESVGNGIEFAVAKYNREVLPTLAPRDRTKKRVCALEMGGKGFIIVDCDADLDEAVVGVSDSAFGFQGQKCSACSRVIVMDSVYDEFVRRLSERVRGLTIGSPEDAKNMMGPMVGEEHHNNVLRYMELAEREGTVLARGVVPDELKRAGYFLPPMLVGDVSPYARVAQEEIFGPVLVVFRAKNLDAALELANNSAYGLTGGIYSRNPEHQARAKREANVGNFYINRKITGAEVGRQPFGGVKMSGNGTKAGGWDYLLNFVQRKAICENTVRRGVTVQ